MRIPREGGGGQKETYYHGPTMVPELGWPRGGPLGALSLKRFFPMILASLLDFKILPKGYQNELKT